MQSINDELVKRNVQVVAISADPVEKLREYMSPKGFTFPLLSDPTLEVISQFGLVHSGGNPFGGDISRPALILILENRQVGFFLQTDNWRVRPTPEEILREVERFGETAQGN